MIDVVSYYRNLLKDCSYNYLILFKFESDLDYKQDTFYDQDAALFMYERYLSYGFDCVFIEL